MISKRVYILGTGNVGCFVAHSLQSISSRPQIALLLHKQALIKAWKRRGGTIDLRTDQVSHTRGGFEVELAIPPSEHEHNPASSVGTECEPIDSLVVAVKAQNTVAALRSIKHRLTPKSTILFLQNGMGFIDEVDKRLFPSRSDRPHYMIGINSHGLNGTEPFVVTHAGHGTINIGSTSPGGEGDSFDYLQQVMLQSKALNAIRCSPSEVLQLQWEKLVANLVINPLTAILDCPNGRLTEPDMEDTVRVLLKEISAVIQALPEMSASTKELFLPDRLHTLVITIATKTAKNISSMLQDIHAGKATEIAFITGYLLKRAEELAVRCVENEKLMQMVLSKQKQVSKS